MSSASTWYSYQPTRVRSIARRWRRAEIAAARRISVELVRVLDEAQRVERLAHVDDLLGRRDAGARAAAHLVQEIGDLAGPTRGNRPSGVYSAGWSAARSGSIASSSAIGCASSKPKISRAASGP